MIVINLSLSRDFSPEERLSLTFFSAIFQFDQLHGMTKEEKKRPIVFVLIDGVGDVSIPSQNTRQPRELEGDCPDYDGPSVSYSTPLQSTSTPFLDSIARMFRIWCLWGCL